MTDEWCPPSGEHSIPKDVETVTANHNDAAQSATCGDLVLGVSEADFRLVDAFFYELALDASNDPSPPTREEQAANAALAASFARLKAMSPDELRVERARRLAERRRRDGR